MAPSKLTIACSLAFAATALALPLQARTFSLGDRTQSVLLDIPVKDVDSLKSFISKTLDTGEAGLPREWHSSARGNKAQVKLPLTPSPVVETEPAGRCRMLSAEVSQRSQTEAWKVWFCQKGDENWKISGLNCAPVRSPLQNSQPCPQG